MTPSMSRRGLFRSVTTSAATTGQAGGEDPMKAGINTRYGGPEVVEVRDAPKPEPKEKELLIRVHATTVNRTDCGMRTPYPFFARAFFGLWKPKLNILGLDFAGEVVDVGAKVTSFKRGDKVFSLSPRTYGAHADYLCAPEDGPIATLPAGVDFAEAAPIEGAWYSGMILKAFGLGPGHTILIYGTSGAIGTAAVQLAKSYGATVTAVCASPHVELAKSIGADRVIDYESQDYTAIGETFDFVLDVAREQGTGWVDLAATLSANWEMFYDECHLTKAGNAAVAKIVGPVVLEQLGVAVR